MLETSQARNQRPSDKPAKLSRQGSEIPRGRPAAGTAEGSRDRRWNCGLLLGLAEHTTDHSLCLALPPRPDGLHVWPIVLQQPDQLVRPRHDLVPGTLVQSPVRLLLLAVASRSAGGEQGSAAATGHAHSAAANRRPPCLLGRVDGATVVAAPRALSPDQRPQLGPRRDHGRNLLLEKVDYILLDRAARDLRLVREQGGVEEQSQYVGVDGILRSADPQDVTHGRDYFGDGGRACTGRQSQDIVPDAPVVVGHGSTSLVGRQCLGKESDCVVLTRSCMQCDVFLLIGRGYDSLGCACFSIVASRLFRLLGAVDGFAM
ncbi:hypothetical protein PpBr36_04029 [Pyricularia pennisetigena]|uniref:hypothetical protein n=1 Tax=Pyricularia pennisetigena TaxID=1578925 RepID=UPI0011504041|nr:hypothetical protein PpBr36_04029 [Pyricularia pennisetigena]TLS26500.1 hypothetical protein PpBr36_04029 [Pyricularia pennisetigena]